MRSVGKLAILSEGLSLQHSPISLILSTVCDSTIPLSGSEEVLTAWLPDSPQGTAYDVSHSTSNGQASPEQGSIDTPGDPTQGPAKASADKPDQSSDNAESETVLPGQKLFGKHAEQAAPKVSQPADAKQAGADPSTTSLPLDAASVSEAAMESVASGPVAAAAASAEEAAAASATASEVATAPAVSEPAAATAVEAAAASAPKAAGGSRAAREAAQRGAELLLLEAIQVATAMVDAYPHVHDELVAVLAGGLKQALGKLSMAMSACMSAVVTAGPCCIGTKHSLCCTSKPYLLSPCVTGLM